MALTVFYSWQSDSPNSVNRSFIENALKQALKEVRKDFSIEVAHRDLELDKDTKGVPGQPEIANVIFDKISKCAIFVPDLTFIGKTEENRWLMNPNVLIEYGYALAKPSRERIVAVMNTAYGEPSDVTMPFDMKHVRHPIKYKLKEDSSPEEKKKTLQGLTSDLREAFKTIILSGVLNAASDIQTDTFVENESTYRPSAFLKADEVLFEKRDVRYKISGAPHMFLRLIPTVQVEKLKYEKDALEFIKQGHLSSFAANSRGGSYDSERNGYGACVYTAKYNDGTIFALTQLFLNKEIWGIDAYLLDKHGAPPYCIPSQALEDYFNVTLQEYLKFAEKQLQIPAPLKIIAGLTRVKGYVLSVHASIYDFTINDKKAVKDDIVWTGEVIDYSQKTSVIFKPFYEHVWNECGLKRPESFNASNN